MIRVLGMTDVGLVRKDNQDAYATAMHEAGYTVCVVCDGMGGVAGGAVASRIAVDSFMKEILKVLRPGMTAVQLEGAVSYACSLANKSVCLAAEKSETIASMGTTLVAAVSFGDQAVVANVGDSRAYHISEEGIRQITRDHSLVEDMLERGEITSDEARRHPNRNLITRALGPDMVTQCDTFVCALKPEEYLLLCSDGLVNTVTDQEILFEVLHGDDPMTCLDRLLEIAKTNGAPDNVTIVLMEKLREGGE